MATIIELPLISAEGVVAEIFDIETGEHYDSAFNYESALTYVQGGKHVAVAVADDGEFYPVSRMAERFDWERKLYEDCYADRRVEFAA